MRSGRAIRVLALAVSCNSAVPGLASPPPDPGTPPPVYDGEDVRYASGSLRLAAELLMPRGKRPHPGAVIIQGSGPSDRTNTWARDIAELLAQRGIAVLLTDKRGSGASEGDWRTADFGALAQDALAGVGCLRARRGIDPARVGLVGLSQGGWVAPLAAARSEQVAFVIDVSGAAVSFAEQTMIEMANTARQAGLSESQVSEVLELNRAVGRYLFTGEWERYARARSRALQTEWGKIAAGLPESPELPIWNYLRGVAAYDPMPYWILVSQPVLVLYGAEDERDNVPVMESVRRLEHAFRSVGKQNYRIVVIPGAGHGFLDARLGLMPAFTEALASWVAEHVTR